MQQSTKTNWIFFPKSEEPPRLVREVVAVFEAAEEEIEAQFDRAVSDVVLAILRPGLERLGFQVESGKLKTQKIY